MLDERSILIGLDHITGIGTQTIHLLLNRLNTLQQLFTLDLEDLTALGIPAARAANLKRDMSRAFIDSVMKQYVARQIEIVTILDQRYPPLLKEIACPPVVLYVRGQISLLHEPCIGMVGTRVPTAYGKKVADVLSRDLSSAGFTVVSGLARGIDSMCHQAALPHGGRTIAVLGTAIDVIYPPEHRSLHEEIAEKGCIVSEYPIGMKSHPGLFPQRNRIIAGLSLGVVVVEADVRSGSLITADAALDASREVFAVPGPITSPKSQGTLNLIRQGAKLVTHANDIIEEFASWRAVPHTLEVEAYSRPPLTNEEETIYRMIESGPISFEQILEKSETNFGHLHSVLLSLLIKKVISQLPGSLYIINE